MKKIAFGLAIILCLSIFSITVYAQQNIPVSAVVSELSQSELSVKIYTQDVKKLVSMRVLIEYDASRYTLKQGKASTHTDSYGDEAENLPGMWVLGTLANGTGCTGSFISVNGVTKSGETAACEFILTSNDGDVSTRDVVVSVTELITDDNNSENDIRKKTVLSYESAIQDKKVVFNYITENGAATITEIATENEAVFVPDTIDGLILRRIKTDAPCEIPFLVFDRNILGVDNGAFNEKNTVVAPLGSAPVAAVRKTGGKHLAYTENVVVDTENKLIYTDSFLTNTESVLFSGTADFEISPSYIYTGGYYGTGTIISVSSGNKFLDLVLCVKGDVNGDSVCDALDANLCEKVSNGHKKPSLLEEKAVDFNFDNNVTVEDYAQAVNIALSGEYQLFDGVRGDLNDDYTVDILDITEFNRLCNKTDLTENEKAFCDFNNDGEITDTDRELLTEIIFDFV